MVRAIKVGRRPEKKRLAVSRKDNRLIAVLQPLFCLYYNRFSAGHSGIEGREEAMV